MAYSGKISNRAEMVLLKINIPNIYLFQQYVQDFMRPL